jgi:PBP1b-binding outer membrane lipoprotein LpoB
LRKTSFIALLLLILSLIGCNSATANSEQVYKIAYVPVEVINAPPNVDIDIDSIKASLDTRSDELAISFRGAVKNNTNGTIRFLKYSLRSYANNKKLFAASERFLTGHEKLDIGMNQDIIDLIIIENYTEPLPDKIIIEITDWADY